MIFNYFLPLCVRVEKHCFPRRDRVSKYFLYVIRILFLVFPQVSSLIPRYAKASPSQKVKERRKEGTKGRKEGRRRHECVRMKCIYARHRHVGKDRRLRVGPGVRVGE